MMKKLNMRQIKKIHVGVTYRCNSRCISCNIWKEKKDVSKEISLKDFTRISRSDCIKSVEEISLCGGEVFLRDDIVDIVKIFSDNTNAKINFITNGLLPNTVKYKVKEMKDLGLNLGQLGVSLNGNEKTHDLTRGIKGSFKKVIKTVNIIKKLDIKTGLGFTITPLNYNQIEWAYKFAKKNEIEIMFLPAIYSKAFFNQNSTILNLDNEKKTVIISQLKKIYNEKKDYFIDDGLLLYTEKVFQNKKVCNCYAGFWDITVFWDGNVYPCLVASKEMLLGNIRTQTLDEIWNSKKTNRMLDFIAKNGCQPCYLICEIVPSLYNEFFPVLEYTIKRRLINK